MRYNLRWRGALALTLTLFWVAACTNDTPTEPTTKAQSPPTVPELAVASNSWLTRANMPRNRTYLALATVKNAAGQSIVYAIGGNTPDGGTSNNLIAYNVATNTWTFRQPLPARLATFNNTLMETHVPLAGAINGKIYVGNWGWDRSSGFITPFYMYDPTTNTWTQKRDIPVVPPSTVLNFDQRYPGGPGVTGVLDGKLYVVSGCFEDHGEFGLEEACNPLFYRYNPATDLWVRLTAPWPQTIRTGQSPSTWNPSIGGVIAGKLYVMADGSDGLSWFGARFSVYDPATKQWTPRHAPALMRRGAASAVLAGKLYVMGGTRLNAAGNAWETLALTTVYNPTTDSWAQRAVLPSPREGIAGTTVLVNGKERIEVVGGGAPGNNIQYVP
jgi:N-acetylneuraminic acid mutarotase